MRIMLDYLIKQTDQIAESMPECENIYIDEEDQTKWFEILIFIVRKLIVQI